MTQQTKRCGALGLLPPKPGVCQTCASDHEPEEPHNQRSLYYRYAFLADNGRWPTWKDAMAHCPKETQEVWTGELKKLGVKI